MTEIDDESASNFNIFITIHLSLGVVLTAGLVLMTVGSVLITHHLISAGKVNVLISTMSSLSFNWNCLH